ncbi:hypothetical protein PInf_005308 [Phytophthora infestans]|nr:hypothetical protein PInf_005308 [Phytophthora infestans]
MVALLNTAADASQEEDETNDHTLNTELHDDDKSGAQRAMDAGDEVGKDDLQNEEDAGDECSHSYISAETDGPEATKEDVGFAERFLGRFGGEGQGRAGKPKGAVMREMPASGWNGVEKPDTYDHMMAS